MEYSPKIKQQKIWQVKTPFPALQQILARELGISLITAQLLINRGFYTVEQCRDFFHCGLGRLYHPLLLKDMGTAVRIINQAVQARKKILVYGDYDADGITAAVLLVQVMRHLGGVVEYYIPNRLDDGYGLHIDALMRCKEKGTSLIVTVDCGISALEEAAWARENGLDLIITDHHEPPPVLPQAPAVINPKRPDCGYPFKDLAGVGVALKLAQALLENDGYEKQAWHDYLDLCCLGTIADIVPLHGENRILVKHGLSSLANSKRPGIQALIGVSGIKDTIGASEVGFRLVPRLNAAGRIGSPDLAARLLLTDNIGEAWELANELHTGNKIRQEIEAKVMQESLAMLGDQPGTAKEKVIVLASAGWHPGVIGIVAARLLERFYRPVLLISLEEETGKGSARSIPAFNIYGALSQCREYLLKYGGHALAAGFSLPADKIEEFSREINNYAGKVLDDKKMVPRLNLDGLISLNQVSEELVNEIELMQPYGHSNPVPLLGCREALVKTCRGVGRDSAHLKMLLYSEGVTVDGIGFDLGAYAEVLATNESVDLAFVPGINEYNGRRSLQLEVKDVGIPALLELSTQENIKSSSWEEYATKNVSQNQEELFIPEFILETLNNGHSAEMRPYLYEMKNNQAKPEFIDLRESIDRQDRLRDLAADEIPTVIITACAYQTIEIAYYLQLSFPSLKGKLACCHGLLPEKDLLENAVRFQNGELSILVATPSMARSLNIKAGRAIIYHLPFNRTMFNNVTEMVQTKGSVYLLFGTDDFEKNSSYLAALTPDRDCLALFYTIVRRKINKYGRFILEPGQMVRSLRESGFLHVREYTVQIAIKVLQELGLLKAEGKEEAIHVSLLPAPGGKRDLHSSQTYLRLHRVREESMAWMMKLLKDPLNNFI